MSFLRLRLFVVLLLRYDSFRGLFDHLSQQSFFFFVIKFLASVCGPWLGLHS